MPFTLAHPAAVIPLRRALGRNSVLSAMVIGSMAPDLHNFLPVDLGRTETHTVAGTILFCLPMGMLVYLLFHMLVKQPLLSLLPERVACRFDGNAPLAPPHAVLLSLLFGTMTHFMWDTFTHADALGVALLPILGTHVFSVRDYPVFLYKLVQHGSALIGLMLMGWWAVRWLRRPPSDVHGDDLSRFSTRPMLSPVRRIVVISAAVLLAGIAGLGTAAATIEPPFDIYALRDFIREAVITAISTLGAAGFIYSISWHIAQLRRG